MAGFLADRGRVPPAVVDAGLDPLRATLAFGLPLVLVAVTEFRLRLPARATWPLTPLIVAWLVIAFAETAIASADLTAIVLAAGVIPAVLIGSHLGWLRRVAGRSPEGPRWTRLRRLLTMTAAIVVAAWTCVYLFLGMIEASGQVRLPPGLFPLGG